MICCSNSLVKVSFCCSWSASCAIVTDMVAKVVLSAAVAVAKLARSYVVSLKVSVSISLAWLAPWHVAPCNVCCCIRWSC